MAIETAADLIREAVASLDEAAALLEAGGPPEEVANLVSFARYTLAGPAKAPAGGLPPASTTSSADYAPRHRSPRH